MGILSEKADILRDEHLIHIKAMPSSNGVKFTSWEWCLMIGKKGGGIEYVELPNSVTYEEGMNNAINEAIKHIKP
ncbi:MAG: hypothetical protein V4721_10400 [Bacteroidota bacterium]